jgi:hypothetical protein
MMKNALALYIEGLARLAARNGTLPKRAASADALAPVWRSLREAASAELERRMAGAAAKEILAASPKARAALAEAEPFGPVAEALAKLRTKTVVPSSMRSAEWAQVPAAIREAAQFSAGVTSARALAAIQRRLESDTAWDFAEPKGREAFIRDMRAVMEAEGLGWETSGEGSLTNPRANSRLGMIYDQQTASARNYAAHKIAMDPDMLDAVPAQELARERDSKVKRDWTRRFRAAGGEPRGGRLAALKTDPVWTRLSRFGVPWPPFDFGSGMGLRDLLRDEAETLGLLRPDQTLTPEPPPDFRAAQTASVANLPPEWVRELAEGFGGRLSVSAGRARLAPPIEEGRA